MPDLEQDLLNALEAAESTAVDNSSDCGCGGKASAADFDPFGSEDFSVDADLGSQLDSALAEVELSAGPLTLEEELEFAALSDTGGVSIADIAALAEKYPGLKITFSS
jgi:hypothetical protein